MSTKGSHIRQVGRDHAKFRDNMDEIDMTDKKPLPKHEIPKEQLPTGVRTRIVYGRKA
jgi:hypothetical protein